MAQGTVKAFDPQRGAGSLLLDSQEELTFDASAFARSGLEELRIGQRVHVEITGSGDERRVTDVTLVSFPPSG